MIKYFFLYISTIPIFAFFDLIWLGIIAKNFYRPALGHLLGSVNWFAVIVFYLIYIAGILFFATLPSLEKDQFLIALAHGALLGFFAYGTYDLTNLATLKNWPIKVVVVDIIWGSILTSALAGISFWIGKMLNTI